MLATLILAVVAARAGAQPPAPADDAALRTAILAADDARVTGDTHRAAIVRGLAATAPEVRVLAIRAAGRTMRQDFLTDSVKALSDPSIDVRREAAFAVAHIGSGPSGALSPAATALSDAMARETDALVVAALAENLGRLPVADASAIASVVAAVRTGIDRVSPGSAPSFATLGAARGAEALARRAARIKVTSPPLNEWLGALLDGAAPPAGPSRPDPVAVRIRRLGMSGLIGLDAVSAARTAAALADADAQVRRLGVLALARLPVLPADAGIAHLKDPAFLVRHAVASRLGPKVPALATAALDDAHLNVRLAALDALGQAAACRDACSTRLDPARLREAAWHETAHALVALARTAPDEARPHVTRLAGAPAPEWQLRMYAARAAGLTKQVDALRLLAADANVNVRHAALAAWREAGVPGVADAARAALGADDGQLLIEAATALKGTASRDDTVKALRGALERLTRAGRDSSRDPRVALLERIDELDPDRATTLRSWLDDADAVVAERAAALIDARLGTGTVRAAPARATAGSARPRVRVPTWVEVKALESSTITFTLRGGRTLTMRLYPQVAPTAVARLVEQVRAGEWNGRTLHRVEPGFVVQGGSPAANEYAGAAAYTRDEFSTLSNVRGTVGISTRGPDTGDGQIYVNLVDNARLDFAFTLIGSIGGDLSGLDDLVEGEEIVAATVVGGR